MSYFAKLTGEDLSRLKNRISRFKKSLLPQRQTDDFIVSATKCWHLLALRHGGQNSWHR